MTPKTENELRYAIIGAAIDVHRELGGPGLLESVYEEALCYELPLREIRIRRQVVCPINYKGTELRKRFVIDVMAEDKVIIEVKAVEQYAPIFGAQLLTYLRLSNRRLGLVINFGESHIRQGVRRVVNNL